MKKILIVTNVMTLIFLYFQSCETISGVTDGNGSFQINKEPIYSSCYNCVTDDIHGETASEFTDVTSRYRYTHQRVYNAYVTNQLTGMSTSYAVDKEFKDARSCWYSVDTLKKFICLLEKYSAKVDLKSSKLGVRFYYANYPITYKRDELSQIHHTLFLTATYANDYGLNVDFEPRVSAATGKVTDLGDLMKEQWKSREVTQANPKPDFFNKSLFMIAGTTSPLHYRTVGTGSGSGTGSTSTSSVSMNQGDLCPPSSDCNVTLDAVDGFSPDPAP